MLASVGRVLIVNIVIVGTILIRADRLSTRKMLRHHLSALVVERYSNKRRQREQVRETVSGDVVMRMELRTVSL